MVSLNCVGLLFLGIIHTLMTSNYVRTHSLDSREIQHGFLIAEHYKNVEFVVPELCLMLVTYTPSVLFLLARVDLY